MQDFLGQLHALVRSANASNLGDVLQEVVGLVSAGPSNADQLTLTQLGFVMAHVDESMSRLYKLASRADIGWKLFAQIDRPTKAITDEQALQIIAVSRALREAAFCFANLSVVARFNTSGTTTISFFINSLCNNVSAWFLLDAKENAKHGFSKPGSIIKVLEPIGLAHLLDPIYFVLERPLGSIRFRDAILQIRNQAIVHTKFLPEDIKRLFTHSELHKMENKLQMNALWNELGNEILILELKLLAVFYDSGKDLKQTVLSYMGDLLGPDFNLEDMWANSDPSL